MEIHNTFVGADGKEGITVYKSIDKKVIEEIKLMYFFKYNTTHFETKQIYSFRNYDKKNKYTIIKDYHLFFVTKTNPNGKVFKYHLYCHYDKKSGNLVVDKFSKMKNGKVKMRMYGNSYKILNNKADAYVLYDKVS